MKRSFGIVVALLALFGTVAEAKLPVVGEAAPDFALKSTAGRNLRLKEMRGEVVLINFWATWCGPCRQELPQLNKLHEQYAKAGFTLLGINVDADAKSAAAMAARLGVTFPVLHDRDKRVSRLYGVDTMPATLIVDRSGKVRHVHRGYQPGVETKYQAQVKELLKE